jgi:hypothetical protein
VAERDVIAEFWIWWTTARPSIERALADGDVSPVNDQLTARVKAIDPGLAWELGPGGDDSHGLALCWDGDIARRRTTGAWCARAPDSKTWRFFPGRPPGAWKPMVFDLDGKHAIAFAEFACTFAVDKTRERVDIALFHAGAAKASKKVHETAAVLLLDRAFGEDGVERWIGTIDVPAKRPRGAKPFADLVAAVKRLERGATGERWNVYSGERGGTPLIVARNEALKAIDHLDFDHELAVAVAYADRGDGMPTPDAHDALETLEESLVKELGGDAAYHGRETTAGTRTMYWFANVACRARVAGWARERDVQIEWTADPAWTRLDRW